jgi:Zn-dependent peptidase ImmA (M78 family)
MDETENKEETIVVTIVEEFKQVSMEDLIEESAQIIRKVVNVLYSDILEAACVKTAPKLHIMKDPSYSANERAAYLAGQELIVLNAVNLQGKDLERIAYVLAHEVWHHKQWEDGETFHNYIVPSANQSGYEAQRIEQEANDFAASLFPNALVA